MPDIVIRVPSAVTPRLWNALRHFPQADSTLPPDTLTTAERWAHIEYVTRQLLKNAVKSQEVLQPDSELDAIS